MAILLNLVKHGKDVIIIILKLTNQFAWLQSEPGRSTLNVLNYKYKYFPPRKYLSTSTFLFGEMYLSTFRVL